MAEEAPNISLSVAVIHPETLGLVPADSATATLGVTDGLGLFGRDPVFPEPSSVSFPAWVCDLLSGSIFGVAFAAKLFGAVALCVFPHEGAPLLASLRVILFAPAGVARVAKASRNSWAVGVIETPEAPREIVRPSLSWVASAAKSCGDGRSVRMIWALHEQDSTA
jgi:hypothetical protein